METQEQKKEPLSKMELIQLFAQSLGQPIKCSGGHFVPEKYGRDDHGRHVLSAALLADFEDGTFKTRDFVLIKRDLADISRDEMEELMVMRYGNFPGTMYSLEALEQGTEALTKLILQGLPVPKAITDYLQKKEFALPYGSYKVSQLIDAEIFELKKS